MIYLNLFDVFIVMHTFCSLDVSLPLLNAWKSYVPVSSIENIFTFLLQYLKNAPHKKTEM